MWAYLSILIPVIVAVILHIAYKKEITWWWEPGIGILGSLICIFIYKAITEKLVTDDIEYRGSVIMQAQYYEPYETWVHKTCTYTTCSGSGKSRTCVTHTYDCSYCSPHEARYVVIDNTKRSWDITREKYIELRKRWNVTPQFNELNRNIIYHGSCGKDGDMYSIYWDQKVETSESATWTSTYTNKVQSSHSAFKLPIVTEEEAKAKQLYEYPDVGNYTQETLLGLEQVYSGDSLELFKRYYRYLNGYCGTKYHARIYTMLFVNKPLQTAMLQKAYWDGGNDNEIGVCIGLDSNKKLSWVYVFTWCDNKRIAVEIRENIMERQYFHPIESFSLIHSATRDYFKPKNFLDFDYISVDMPVGALIGLYLLVLAISLGTGYWCIKNCYTN